VNQGGKKMRALRNEKGLALLSTLMLLVLGFGVVAMLLRLVTAETKLAALEQGYTTALDAGKAGTDMFLFMIQNGTANPPNQIGASNASNVACVDQKMYNPKSSWTTAVCPDQSPNPDPTNCPSPTATCADPTISPDVTMTLSNCTVYLKIVDTTETAPVAPPNPSDLCHPNGCYYYTVNVRSIASGTNERADITFVYRFPK